MAEDPVKLTDDEKAAIEKYKASLEKGTDDKEDDKELSKSEKRFQTLANERTELREKLNASQAIVDQMKADVAEKERNSKIDSGDYKAVITDYKGQVSTLEDQLAVSKLDLMRYKIGIDLGLPSAIAEILRGDDHESISIFAEKLKVELPKPAGGFSDGRQTGQPPTVKGNGQPTAGRYEAVSVEVL